MQSIYFVPSEAVTNSGAAQSAVAYRARINNDCMTEIYELNNMEFDQFVPTERKPSCALSILRQMLEGQLCIGTQEEYAALYKIKTLLHHERLIAKPSTSTTSEE